MAEGNFYVSYLPLSEIPATSMSEKSFETLVAVQKNAQKSLGFRKRLITACQEEFRSAVCSVRTFMFLLISILFLLHFNKCLIDNDIGTYSDVCLRHIRT